MPEYTVIYEGTVREQYLVEADSEEEAREKWSDNPPMSSEMIDGEVTEVIREDAD
ncbi:hypothetical protein [Nesterenkonia suensis]